LTTGGHARNAEGHIDVLVRDRDSETSSGSDSQDEVVSRALKDFKAQGLIGISSSRITILDEKRLREGSVCEALK
jgi:CRP-like cAMP-binding protein